MKKYEDVMREAMLKSLTLFMEERKKLEKAYKNKEPFLIDPQSEYYYSRYVEKLFQLNNRIKAIYMEYPEFRP